MLGANPEFKIECETDDLLFCSQPLRKGEVAPFSGQLLTPALALDQAQRVDFGGRQCKIEIDKTVSEGKITERLVQELWAQDQVLCEQKQDFLKQRLAEAKENQKVPWYEAPVFVAIVTVLVTTAITAGAIKGVEALK